MSRLKRIVVFVAVLIFILSVTLPLSAFAVDPVSATVMANAFAQAIAAYGASNGVAMTFDVASTDGIGESVHELWKDFREGTQTADDYATLAAAIFPDLYYKSSVALGTASDVYAVGVHISDTYAETFDEFYNWLLSGPAEMVQVDNQYYQFSQSQIGPDSSPLPVLSLVIYPLPLVPYLSYASDSSSKQLTYENSLHIFGSSSSQTRLAVAQNTYPVFVFYLGSSSQADCYVMCSALSTYYRTTGNRTTVSTYSSFQLEYSSSLNMYLRSAGSSTPLTGSGIPIFSSWSDVQSFLQQNDLSNPSSDSVGVKAYRQIGIADIPDTTDPNYDALNRAKDIPLNIPWDDSIYGDGTGTLSDVQIEAIADDVVAALEQDQIVELVEEENPPAPSPDPDYSDVLLPLIPINVPSFDFSLSGIWHYVRDWVNSLGAWLSTLFSVWSILPYAIVVPVYACLVVVIVLGLYKRFFM